MENDENIKEAKKVYDEINEDEHEKYLAELRQKYIMDMYDFEETGFDKGMEKGIEQGIKQGKKESTITMVIKMLKEKIDIEKISTISDLSTEEIIQIKQENNL